jgi:transposase
MAVTTRRRMVELHETRKMKAAQSTEDFGIAEKTFYKWKCRFRLKDEVGLSYKSTAPHHSPRTASPELEAMVIEAWKREPKSPLYLAQLPELKGKVSVHGIHRILVRRGFNRLRTPSKIAALRYEAQCSWELVHLDVKYLPAIEGQKGREYEFTAIDDRTREVFCHFPQQDH